MQQYEFGDEVIFRNHLLVKCGTIIQYFDDKKEYEIIVPGGQFVRVKENKIIELA